MMTDSLYITVDAEDWSDDVERDLAAEATSLSGMGFRLITPIDDADVLLEPFFGSASFAALLSVGRELSSVREAISAIVSEAFRHTEGVGVLVRSEERSGAGEIEERFATLAEVLGALPGAKNTWFKLRPPLRMFDIAQVEAKLYQPLELDSGGVATHYFREYQVAAQDVKHARQMIAEDLAADGAVFLGWQAVEVTQAYVSSDSPAHAAILGRSGRVYFTD